MNAHDQMLSARYFMQVINRMQVCKLTIRDGVIKKKLSFFSPIIIMCYYYQK